MARGLSLANLLMYLGQHIISVIFDLLDFHSLEYYLVRLAEAEHIVIDRAVLYYKVEHSHIIGIHITMEQREKSASQLY
jgi:hypothetical protein